LGSQATFEQHRPHHDADLKEEDEEDEEGLWRYAPGGFHPVRLGERYDNDRYEVLRKLGFGRYSTVWLVRDLQQSRYLAMKVLDAASYDEAAQDVASERQMLKHLRQADPTHPGYTYVNHLIDSFEHEGPNGRHVCLLFEPMGETLWSYPTWFPEGQLPATVAKPLAAKLLASLQYIHSCAIIHTGDSGYPPPARASSSQLGT
jgi:serine/threonine-protein kinase SRPK3